MECSKLTVGEAEVKVSDVTDPTVQVMFWKVGVSAELGVMVLTPMVMVLVAVQPEMVLVAAIVMVP